MQLIRKASWKRYILRRVLSKRESLIGKEKNRKFCNY